MDGTRVGVTVAGMGCSVASGVLVADESEVGTAVTGPQAERSSAAARRKPVRRGRCKVMF
jgi:hypothetical protein